MFLSRMGNNLFVLSLTFSSLQSTLHHYGVTLKWWVVVQLLSLHLSHLPPAPPQATPSTQPLTHHLGQLLSPEKLSVHESLTLSLIFVTFLHFLSHQLLHNHAVRKYGELTNTSEINIHSSTFLSFLDIISIKIS